MDEDRVDLVNDSREGWRRIAQEPETCDWGQTGSGVNACDEEVTALGDLCETHQRVYELLEELYGEEA